MTTTVAGAFAAAVPPLGLTVSQPPPDTVDPTAVKLNEPPPALPTLITWLDGTASRFRENASGDDFTLSLGKSEFATVNTMAIVCVGELAFGALIVTLP